MKMGEKGKTIRLGILGLGCRGYGQTELLAAMPDIQVRAVYDPYPDRMEKMIRRLRDMVSWSTVQAESEEKLLSRDDIDAVVIMTDWESHIRLAIRAMELGKHAPPSVREQAA